MPNETRLHLLAEDGNRRGKQIFWGRELQSFVTTTEKPFYQDVIHLNSEVRQVYKEVRDPSGMWTPKTLKLKTWTGPRNKLKANVDWPRLE